MNVVNNKRRRDSQYKIEKAFANLIQKKNLNEIWYYKSVLVNYY